MHITKTVAFNLKLWVLCDRYCYYFSLLQRLIHNELIFRLLLKVTVDWPHECISLQFMKGFLPQRKFPYIVYDDKKEESWDW